MTNRSRGRIKYERLPVDHAVEDQSSWSKEMTANAAVGNLLAMALRKPLPPLTQRRLARRCIDGL